MIAFRPILKPSILGLGLAALAGGAAAAGGAVTPLDRLGPGYPVLLPYAVAFESGGVGIRCGEVSLAIAAKTDRCVHRMTAIDIEALRGAAARGASGPTRLPSGVSMTVADDETGAPGVAAADAGDGVEVALGSRSGEPDFRVAADSAVSSDIVFAEEGRIIWLDLAGDANIGAATTAAVAPPGSGTAPAGGATAGASVGGVSVGASLGGGGGISVGAAAGESVGAGASVGGETGGVSVGAAVGGVGVGATIGQ